MVELPVVLPANIQESRELGVLFAARLDGIVPDQEMAVAKRLLVGRDAGSPLLYRQRQTLLEYAT